MSAMMKAAVLSEPGPVENLQLRELPIPVPPPGWVRIKVEAFGLNRSELHTRLGLAEGVTFPLPMRDPRGIAPVEAPLAAPLETATLVSVPLPRRRPAGPGETAVATPVQESAETELRLVQFGDKVVRVVGPDTPYAQPTGAGT